MKRLLGLAVCVLAALLTGCATTTVPAVATPTSAAGGAAPAAPVLSKADPWENFNRKIFAFNDVVDAAVLKPVAEAYTKVLPSLVRAGVSNVFGNVGDAWSAVNQMLQGKVVNSVEMATRFAVNSTIGLVGMLDPASEMGLERKREDFGQTMGVWGIPTGPFVVLPLLGPSSVRETAAFTVDRIPSVGNIFTDNKYINYFTVVELVNTRAELLPATRMLDQIALDKYSFVRDAYIARRRNLVYDGNPPPEPEDPEAPETLPTEKPAAKEPAAKVVSPKDGAPKEAVPPK